MSFGIAIESHGMPEFGAEEFTTNELNIMLIVGTWEQLIILNTFGYLHCHIFGQTFLYIIKRDSFLIFFYTLL